MEFGKFHPKKYWLYLLFDKRTTLKLLALKKINRLHQLICLKHFFSLLDSNHLTCFCLQIGRRLRDSCRNFRGKSSGSNGCHVVSHNPEDYTSLQAPSVRKHLILTKPVRLTGYYKLRNAFVAQIQLPSMTLKDYFLRTYKTSAYPLPPQVVLRNI